MLRSVKKFGIPLGTLKGNVTKAEKQKMDIELLPLIFFPVYATRKISLNCPQAGKYSCSKRTETGW